MVNTQNRYHRQMILDGFGASGQEKLGTGSVLVVGAGGLGCPALLYLAAAGLGRIGIVDPDVVDITNLHRQVLYSMEDLGKPKATAAANRLKILNPGVTAESYPVALNRSNARELVGAYDIILDGTDNFETRYILDDACFILKKPLVYGAVVKMEGHVSLFHAPDQEGNFLSYRDLFPTPPEGMDLFSCRIGGVLGVVPGIIGMYQATEVIKWVSGMGQLLAGQLLLLNIEKGTSHVFACAPQPPGSVVRPVSFDDLMTFDYAGFCQTGPTDREISPEVFRSLASKDSTLVVDLREADEGPDLTIANHVRIPLDKLPLNINRLKSLKTVIFVCQSGVRSRQALIMTTDWLNPAQLYSLKGGLTSTLLML